MKTIRFICIAAVAVALCALATTPVPGLAGKTTGGGRLNAALPRSASQPPPQSSLSRPEPGGQSARGAR